MQVDVLGLAEMRWTESGMIAMGKYVRIFSGEEKNQHGLSSMVTKKVSKALQGYLPISDRVIMARFEGKPMNILIEKLYAPTNDHIDDEIEKFYADVKKPFRQVKSGRILIVMKDMNVKIGKVKYGSVVGKYGLGENMVWVKIWSG